MTQDLTLPHGLYQSWLDEIARLDQQIAPLAAKRQAFQQRIDAVALIFSGSPVGPDKPTLTGFILETLREAARGLTLTDLSDALMDSQFRDQIERNKNSLYNAVSRLTDKGDVVRLGKLIYDKATHDGVQSGTIEDPRINQPDEEMTVPDLILKTLSNAGKALAPGEILDVVRINERFADQMLRNPQYGYTVLGRMLRRKQIEKRGKKYALPGSPVVEDEDDPNALFG